jgi:hypothetical protein
VSKLNARTSWSPFSSVFTKLWKITVSFVVSIRVSICMEQLGSHWMHVREIWCLSIYQKSVKKMQALLKSDKNNGYFSWRPTYTVAHWFLLRMRNVSDKSCRENQNTHFMFRNVFWHSCHLWDSTKKYRRARQATYDNIIQHMHFVCLVTKTTDTHSEYIVLLAYARQQWLHNCTSVLQ